MLSLVRLSPLLAALSLCLVVGTARAESVNPTVTVIADRDAAVYAIGDTATFAITVTRGGTPVELGDLRFEATLDGGRSLATGTLPLGEHGALWQGTLTEPGVLRLKVTLPDGEPPAEGLGAAVYAPEKIQAADTEPDDFVAFWNAQKAALAHVPVDPVLEDRPALATDAYTVQAVSLGTVMGARIHGLLAVPRTPGPHPMHLLVPYAGVYPLPLWMLHSAKDGYVVLAIEAHEEKADLPQEYYDALNAKGGRLENYFRKGLESRDNFYYRRVYLSTVRAIDYLTSRPDWDGRNMVVTGGSQGGGLSLVAAGLDSRVTCIAANVPALCDFQGWRLGRMGGWPQPVVDGDPVQAATVRYYDGVHFARHIRCPALIGVGYVDTVCGPSSDFAVFNTLTGEKDLVRGPHAGHSGPPDFDARAAAWLKAHLR